MSTTKNFYFESLLILFVLSLGITTQNAYAQRGDGAVVAPSSQDEFVPNAIYEIRYWTNMARMGDDQVYIDTMMFFGRDRAAFEYSNANCVSYHCRASDSLVYVVMPKLMTSEKEWILGDFIIKKLARQTANFRSRSRTIFKTFVSDIDTKDSGLGDYVLLSREFGIIFRWNADGEVYMLNRIDVIKDGIVRDEINLLPLQSYLATTDIFSKVE